MGPNLRYFEQFILHVNLLLVVITRAIDTIAKCLSGRMSRLCVVSK